MVVFCGETFEALPADPEFGSDAEPELSPEVEPDPSVDTVPLEGGGDEPFTTVVAPPVEVVIPELVVPVVLAMPTLPVPAGGAAAVPEGFAALPGGEPPASAVPLPPPPHALNTTLPLSAVRQPRN
ncbi:hypothetical protein F6X42_12725 [Paraburkholderia sp. WC7.3b]|uniref:Uncharacterized protein n=1 Tax=Paraburkholderia podalyriae TaxID=1938811 RepID=A0ABR7PM33_9BURK|nr:hypothetical protein [Paraburkholderia podalyriae]MBC8747438.1 hypothetical protein [Paraburkholderia podalyriae]